MSDVFPALGEPFTSTRRLVTRHTVWADGASDTCVCAQAAGSAPGCHSFSMLTVEISPSGFTADEADYLRRLAVDVWAELGALLPLPPAASLRCDRGDDVLDTGDNAFCGPGRQIVYWIDSRADARQIAERQMRKALFHEGYHLARYEKLPDEGAAQSWAQCAVGEGLASVFARDYANAFESWADYDGVTIQTWARELFATPLQPADSLQWKFRHDDGREFIAFRVGCWLVDQLAAATGETSRDWIWVPADELIARAASVPAVAPEPPVTDDGVEQPRIPTVHLMCGLPASGKTTYAAALTQEARAVQFTLDEWMLTLFHLSYDDPAYVAAIPRCKSVIHNVAQQVLRTGHDVVFDWNHWNAARRADSAKWATDHHAKVIVHFIDIPLETAIQRARARAERGGPAAHVLDEPEVRHALTYFEEPSEAEGLTVKQTTASDQ